MNAFQQRQEEQPKYCLSIQDYYSQMLVPVYPGLHSLGFVYCTTVQTLRIFQKTPHSVFVFSAHTDSKVSPLRSEGWERYIKWKASHLSLLLSHQPDWGFTSCTGPAGTNNTTHSGSFIIIREKIRHQLLNSPKMLSCIQCKDAEKYSANMFEQLIVYNDKFRCEKEKCFY